MSFPTGKVVFLHLAQAAYDLPGVVPLSFQTVRRRPAGFQEGHVGGEDLARFGEVAVGLLAVTPQVDTQDLDVFELMDKAPHTVGISIHGHAPRAGPAPFRENHQELFVMEKGVALLQLLLHVVAVAAPLDGNALDQVTEGDQQDIPVEVRPFRKVPGKPSEVQKIPVERQHGVSQDHGINQRQVIRADEPRPSMLPEVLPAGLPDLPQVSDPPAEKTDDPVCHGPGHKYKKAAGQVLDGQRPSG